jgi:hypothetical protein
MSFSTEWNAKVAATWEKIRIRGKTRYVFLRWVVLWGLGTAALITIIERFFRPDHTLPCSMFITAFVVYPLAGIYAGILHWNFMDARYKNYLSQQELKSLSATP